MRVPGIFISSLIAISVSALSCGGDKTEKAEQPTDQPIVVKPVPNVEDRLVRDAAVSMIDKFSTQLRSELMTAMAQGGPASAISVCAEKAPKIAQQLNGGGWTIRRATLRPRNKDNAVGETEDHGIESFQRDTALTHMALWDTDQGRKTYRYFKPIYIQEMCVSCHGDRASMDPAVVTALEKAYPADSAFGYKVGDLRGIFSVAADWPRGKMRAVELIGVPEDPER